MIDSADNNKLTGSGSADIDAATCGALNAGE